MTYKTTEEGGFNVEIGLSGTDFTQDSNCQGAWYMNSDASETDRSGNGNTLTPYSESGDVLTSATVPSGYSGKSRDFESANEEYLYRNDGDLVGLDINGADAKISIVAWFRVDAISSGVAMRIVMKSAADQGQYTVNLWGGAGNTFMPYCWLSPDGTNSTTVNATTTDRASGTWYHIAFVANDTDLRIYINGSLDCTPVAHTTGIFNGSASFRIGTDDGGTGYFDGLIDEVAVFDRELSATEVSNIYTNGISGNKGGSD